MRLGSLIPGETQVGEIEGQKPDLQFFCTMIDTSIQGAP